MLLHTERTPQLRFLLHLRGSHRKIHWILLFSVWAAQGVVMFFAVTFSIFIQLQEPGPQRNTASTYTVHGN